MVRARSERSLLAALAVGCLTQSALAIEFEINWFALAGEPGDVSNQ